MDTIVVFLNISKYIYLTLLFNQLVPGVSGDLSQYCFPENIIITVNCQRLLKSTTITPVCRYDHQPGGQTTTPVDLYFGDIQIASTDRCSETCQVRKTCNRLCHKRCKAEKTARDANRAGVVTSRHGRASHLTTHNRSTCGQVYRLANTTHTHVHAHTHAHTN